MSSSAPASYAWVGCSGMPSGVPTFAAVVLAKYHFARAGHAQVAAQHQLPNMSC